MLKGFKDFLMRGNVVELATAVIIGAAFTAVVTAFTDKIVAPLIAAIPVNTDFAGLGFRIDNDKPGTFLDFGAVITAMINFVIVAAVVYFLIIVPYNKLTQLRTLEEEAEDDSEVSLLVEIRDLLDPDAKKRKSVESAEERFDPPQTGPQPHVSQSQVQPDNLPSGGTTQQIGVPPQAQQQAPPQAPPQGQQYPAGPPSGGFPTPNPAPGEYPPPGNLPPGQYAPGQYPPPAPGQYPQDPGFGDGPRHSR